MSTQTPLFASLTLASLLALAATAGVAAESDKRVVEADAAKGQAEAAKGQADESKSQAERERALADARKRLDEAAREVASLSMSLSEDVVPHMRTFGGAMGGPPRAILGINLGTRDNASGGGVEVVNVSPGGAAERAGLKAGDVLTEINGRALKSDDNGPAREQLLTAMRKVKPGDTVALSYRRDSKVVKTNLVAQQLQDRFFTMAVPPTAGMATLPGMPNFMFMRGEGVFGSAELVPMTAKLGQYFGTDTGLLVVRAPDDSRLKLEDGDVIVDIDGRTPSSPSHALRILSSYQPGEKLKLNILRAKKRMSFEITVPENEWQNGIDGARFERRLYTPGIEAMPALPGPPGFHLQGPGFRVDGPGPISIPAPPLPDEPV
jgi:C-terminal processing protease CtpA/Prc